MTDDSPMNQPPPQQPLPPPRPLPHEESSPRHASRTDARLSREADALDAWLDARALSRPSRNGAAAAPATHHDQTGQNGQWSNPSADAPSLPKAASRFHARFAAAEEAEAPATPVDAIWEQIMVTSQSLAKPASAPPRLVPSKSSGTTAVRPARHPLLQTVGSHPAATALLVAGVIVAMIVLFRSLDRGQHPPIIDYGPAAMVGNGTATATPSGPPVDQAAFQLSTPDANGCIIRTLSPAEEATIANPAALPTPDYAVTGALDDEAITREAATAWASLFGCGDATLADNQEAGALSLYALSTIGMLWTPDTRIPLNEQRLETVKVLSTTLVEQDPTLYTVDANDPAIAPWLGIDGSGKQYVILPTDMQRFADGRIGAPVKMARPGGSGAATKDSYISPQSVTYVFFRQEGGAWLVDEQFQLCTWMCDEYFAGLQSNIDADREINGMSTPITSPEASPSSSPAATDIWLQPITGASCDAPFSSSDPREQSAHLLRQFWSCDSAERLPMMSEDLLARHPEVRNGQYSVSEDDIARAKAISPIVAKANLQLTIVDPGVAANWFPGVFLPQNAIQLEDGRFAIPMTVATSDATPTPNAANEAAMNSNGAVALYIVVIQDGQPRLDDILGTCIGNCDAIWTQQELQIGTPQPGNDMIANQAATAEAKQAITDVWLQPITTAECDTPITTGATYQEQAALLLRSSYACYEGNPDAQDPEAFYSSDFLQRHPEMMESGQYTLSSADVANAEVISTVIAAASPQIYVTGLPGADDQSSRTQGFYEVFLPDQNSIGLSGGRFAIPISIAFPDQAKTTQAATAIANSKDPVTLGIYVFTLQDGGTPRVDDIVFTCIANCDGFWEQERAKVGTPVPGNEEIATEAATASAVAEAKLPIPSSECTVPTVAAGSETLLPRSYSPPLEPTDANATAVNQTARSFIACIEATPSTDADAPPSKEQDVVAPFETDRLREERDATRVQPLTADQIAAGKSVSSYLESQGVTSFAERAPQSVVDSSKTVTPRSVGGWSVTPPGFYTVPMPGVTIQFPDGRIGVPVLQMVTNDDLRTYEQGQPYTSGTLWIFAPVGDTWLVDEAIGLCIGDCDAFWQDAASVSEWLQPVSGSECQPVSADTYREYVRPRDYTIVNTQARPDVARQSRSRIACAPGPFADRSTSDRQFETQRYTDSTDADVPLTTDQLAQAQALSLYYQDTMGYEVIRRTTESVDVSTTINTFTLIVPGGRITIMPPIFLPEAAVGLSDGRIAIPTTLLVSDDGSWTAVQQLPYQVTTLTIWAHVGDTWLVDETLPLCTGDCTHFWSSMASAPQPSPSSDSVATWIMAAMLANATPAASPTAVSTPAASPAASPTTTSTERSGGDNLRPVPTDTPATPTSAKASSAMPIDRRTRPITS